MIRYQMLSSFGVGRDLMFLRVSRASSRVERTTIVMLAMQLVESQAVWVIVPIM